MLIIWCTLVYSVCVLYCTSILYSGKKKERQTGRYCLTVSATATATMTVIGVLIVMPILGTITASLCQARWVTR